VRLQLAGYIDLPAHLKPGGFDHAAVHRVTARLYVAHTALPLIPIGTRSTPSCHRLTGPQYMWTGDDRGSARYH